MTPEHTRSRSWLTDFGERQKRATLNHLSAFIKSANPGAYTRSGEVPLNGGRYASRRQHVSITTNIV